MLSEGKSRFEAELREKKTSLELAEKKLQDVEVLLPQETDGVAQLWQAMQDGNVKIHTLESQVVTEQNKCRELQGEVTAKGEEILRLLNILPPLEISQDFSLI